jgi:hypothetical protein
MELILIAAVIAAFVWWRQSANSNQSSEVSVDPLTAQVQEAQRKAWIKDRNELMLPLEMICGPVPSGFDGDEQVIVCLPDVELMEARAVRYSRGGSSGSSVRIMKGVSIRVGGYAGSSTSVDELTTIDQGTLVVTT